MLMGESPLRETCPIFRETRAIFREAVRVCRHCAGDDVGDRVDLVAGHAGQDGAVLGRHRLIVLSPRAAEDSAHQT